MTLNFDIQNQIIEKIKQINPEKIILFGSYADGTAKYDSDVDIMIVHNVEKSNIRQKRLEIRKLLRPIIMEQGIGFDVLVDNDKNISYRINEIKDQFYKNIFQNGLVIYAK